MSDEAGRQPATTKIPGDRRKPVARYVQFADADVQARFITEAEHGYHALTAADTFEGLGEVELVVAPATTTRRGLFSRSRPVPASTRSVPSTAALARVVHLAEDVPASLAATPHPCASVVRAGRLLATVALELAHDLLELSPAEQAAHPAYRQTLRLAAELAALRDIVASVGCTDPENCVGIRPPEQWGRRLEDVEVTEVRAVLARLVVADDHHP